MEVGDQKFISRSSDGFALSTFGLLSNDEPAVVCGTLVDGRCCALELLVLVLEVCGLCGVSSASSLMFETTLFVDEATSRCRPSRPDRNQPAPVELAVLLDAPPDAPPAALVKYGLGWALRIDLGEPSGEAGNDLEPRRDRNLGWDM